MKHMITLFAMVLGLVFATTAQAGVSGLGWDAGKNQLTVRVGSLDLGVGGLSDQNLSHPTLSANFLLGDLASDEGFTAYTVLGADYSTNKFDMFAGVMPELVVRKHLAFSTRFGVNIPVYDNKFDVHANLTGQPVDLVSAVNFKVLF